ncbi:MAG TPA: type II secretion system protein [Burkholderiales bacterium]|nr:type II secretion system protein [Burkholderiales bacterium]
MQNSAAQPHKIQSSVLRPLSSERGISLVELIIFIVIVSVAVAGVLSVMNITAQHSADPLIRKQEQAIAEALLAEIELQPFTWCDPTDANAAIATSNSSGNPVGSTAGCNTTPEALGPETVNGVIQSRYSATTPFNNVNDYNGFNMSPILDITGTPVAGLGNYSASVAITALSSAELQINVTVTSGNTSLTLTGFRYRYAPDAVP